MTMKGYSAFPKAPALLEPHDQIVQCYIQDTNSADVQSMYFTAPAVWDLAIYWGNGTLLINKYKYFIWVPIDINVVCSRSSRSSAQSESVNIDKHFCMCKYIRSFDWTKVDKKILGGTLKILEKKQISSTDVSRKHTRMIPLSLTSHRTSTPSVIIRAYIFRVRGLQISKMLIQKFQFV